MADGRHKLNLSQTWSMAVGGMVGGGIFSTLGVVVAIAGSWTWLSFVVAGLIALAAGYGYVSLAAQYGEGGGAFTFLRRVDANEFAGGLSWILIVGYVLTNAVYASTFGQYLGHVTPFGAWFPRVAAVAIMGGFVALNLRGVGAAGVVEVVLVWFKLIVLVGLAAWGLSRWNPDMLSRGVPTEGVAPALFGAASVFMAYEGFQLITYDYDDIRDPQTVLPRAVLSAIVVVIVVYVLVALGTTMLIGADQIIAHKEVALAVAGKKAMGSGGLVLVTVAAAFSTGSAINSTLFATARLARTVARGGELPARLAHENAVGIPDRAVVGFGVAAAVLAALGSLTTLVEAASLAFLATFAVVCALAYRERAGFRLATGAGAVGAAAAVIALITRLAENDPLALAFLAGIVLVVVVGRPALLRRVRTLHAREENRE